MNIRTAKILGILLLLILATALCGLELSLGSAESSRDGNHSFADKTGEGDIHRGAIALTDTPVVTPTPTPTPFSHPLLFPPVNTNANVSIGIDQACVQILDGPCTNMWTYGGTYPGITIRRPTGQTTNVTFTNNLDPAAGELTVHNHGNHSSATNDGQPDNLLIATGGSRTYIYDGLEEGANQRGKMQFYHDHRMDVTGRNVWMGLTGMYIVDDPADSVTLPSAAFDLPLAIADRQFDANNQIPYVFDPNGVTGDKIFINGVYQPYLEVSDRKYRLRILNASNARTYFLTLSTGDSFIQIGTESGSCRHRFRGPGRE
jgi:spore coat protein A, manganese oxidase